MRSNIVDKVFKEIAEDGGIAKQILTIMIVEGELSKFHRGTIPEQNFELTINLKDRLTKEQAIRYVSKLAD